MRRLETDHPFDPEVAAALDAIDATLAGEPVDPAHAELAELALLLAADRPRPLDEFTRELDGRVARRFAKADGMRRRPRFGLAPALGGVAAALAATVAVVIAVGSGGSGPVRTDLRSTATASGSAQSNSGAGTTDSVTPQSSSGAGAKRSAVPPSAATSGGAPQTMLAPTNGIPAASGAAPQPPNNGRKIVQSAILALSTSANHIDDVAQGVYGVVGAEHGIVQNSTITATGGPDGSAQFQLSIPSSNLAQTLTMLSRLRYAAVASRSDTTQDVNNQFVDVTNRLADARALRTSLLKQLAAATTQTEIDSLKSQIHDAEASISSDQAQLKALNKRVDFSQLTVTIAANGTGSTPGGGFTISKGWHDAVRVLTVAAGVALIALAALVPCGLLAALAWWIAALARRRRREQALEVA
jgi:hypothetical protein